MFFIIHIIYFAEITIYQEYRHIKLVESDKVYQSLNKNIVSLMSKKYGGVTI
jgi:hypothetical protein